MSSGTKLVLGIIIIIAVLSGISIYAAETYPLLALVSEMARWIIMIPCGLISGATVIYGFWEIYTDQKPKK